MTRCGVLGEAPHKKSGWCNVKRPVFPFAHGRPARLSRVRGCAGSGCRQVSAGFDCAHGRTAANAAGLRGRLAYARAGGRPCLSPVGLGLISLTAAPPLTRLACAGASHKLRRAVALASALAGFGNSGGYKLRVCRITPASVAGQAKRFSFAPARQRTAARRRGRNTINCAGGRSPLPQPCRASGTAVGTNSEPAHPGSRDPAAKPCPELAPPLLASARRPIASAGQRSPGTDSTDAIEPGAERRGRPLSAPR